MTIDLLVVSYNTKDLLIRLLETLNSDYEPDVWKLYIADNGSTDGTAELLDRRDFDHFHIEDVFLNENIGYSAAINQLASVSKSEYLCAVNADTWFTTNHVKEVISSFEQHPKAGVIGVKQMDEDNRVRHGGIFWDGYMNPVHRGWGRYDPQDTSAKDVQQCWTVSGSIYYVRRTAWDECANYMPFRVLFPQYSGAFLPTPHFFEETFCLTGETIVWTEKGPKPIRDILKGEKVYSYNEKAKNFELDEVLWSGKTGVKKVNIIELDRASTLYATDNHHFFGVKHTKHLSGDLLGFVEVDKCTHLVGVKDLSDAVPLPLVSMSDLNVTTEAMQFFGMWLGDGWYNLDRQICFSIPKDEYLKEFYNKIAHNIFQKKTTWRKRGNCGVEETFEDSTSGDNERSTRTYSKAGVDWMKSLGFDSGAYKKRIPAWIFTAPIEYRLALLAGIIDSDGHINKSNHMTIALANEFLIYDIQMLAALCGIKTGKVGYRKIANPFIGKNKKAKLFCESWSIVLNLNTTDKNIAYATKSYRKNIATDKSRPDTFRKKVGLSDSTYATYIKKVSQSDIAVDVYDLTIANNHNFIANGIIVHNCSQLMHHLGWEVWYDGTVETAGHTWKASTPSGQPIHYFEISRNIYKETCDALGIAHECH